MKLGSGRAARTQAKDTHAGLQPGAVSAMAKAAATLMDGPVGESSSSNYNRLSWLLGLSDRFLDGPEGQGLLTSGHERPSFMKQRGYSVLAPSPR